MPKQKIRYLTLHEICNRYSDAKITNTELGKGVGVKFNKSSEGIWKLLYSTELGKDVPDHRHYDSETMIVETISDPVPEIKPGMIVRIKSSAPHYDDHRVGLVVEVISDIMYFEINNEREQGVGISEVEEIVFNPYKKD